MHNRYGAKRFHKAILQAIWANNRAHWNTTCFENATAITEGGDGELLHEVNNLITLGRRSHAHATLSLDKILQDHDAVLRRRAEGWHADREHQLQDGDHDSSDTQNPN
ncbi:hypothetical protein PR003_g34165 [Phytophthora rubi]|uniref:Uncharacterized protein n=2 Tax=Phytophthora TaxID=4783 RepID=A0A6A3GE75_9STRA|nr:hypothetical protein PR001_g33373 [Phytophthora rubi]KAE9260882.1 hypothetical protein PR003_g34165 [Phytophthora rubi]KAE9270493.1 hypothetical protein PF008_g30605 [Phytophthora fragariae]